MNSSTKNGNRTIFIAAGLLLAAGLGWLIFSGISQNSAYFLNVSEALAMDSGKLRQARLFGNVSADNLVRSSDSLGVAFTLVDKEDAAKTMRVEYKGAVPDTFKPGVEVIVEGGVKSGGVFQASTLMTKCPSKYQKENRG